MISKSSSIGKGRTGLLLIIAVLSTFVVATAHASTQPLMQIQSSAGNIISSIISDIVNAIEGIFSGVAKSFVATSNTTAAGQPFIGYYVSGYSEATMNLTPYQHSNPITITITKKSNSTSDRSFIVELVSNSNDIFFTDVHNNTMSSCGPYTINVLNQSNGEICQFEIYALPAPQGGNYTVYTASATAYYNGSVEHNLLSGSSQNPFDWKVTVTNQKK